MPATTVAASATGLPINRARLERIIDNLIALLDETDPDVDLEPSLGWCSHIAHDGSDDPEGCSNFEPNVDLEENTTPRMDDRALYFGEIR